VKIPSTKIRVNRAQSIYNTQSGEVCVHHRIFGRLTSYTQQLHIIAYLSITALNLTLALLTLTLTLTPLLHNKSAEATFPRIFGYGGLNGVTTTICVT